MQAIVRFLKDEEGISSLEWIVLGAVVIVGMAAVFGALQTAMQGTVTNITAEVAGA